MAEKKKSKRPLPLSLESSAEVTDSPDDLHPTVDSCDSLAEYVVI